NQHCPYRPLEFDSFIIDQKCQEQAKHNLECCSQHCPNDCPRKHIKESIFPYINGKKRFKIIKTNPMQQVPRRRIVLIVIGKCQSNHEQQWQDNNKNKHDKSWQHHVIWKTFIIKVSHASH